MSVSGVIFTVAYPKALPFLRNVCESALSQTRKDFDFIVVNDGCDKASIKAAFKGLDVVILDAANGFAANRILGINYAKNHGYQFMFFCDADDTFLPKRYEITIETFESTHADIIACNLNIVDEQLYSLIPDYFNFEIPSDRWIDADYVMTKNIFGLSNTAIRLSSIKETIQIPETKIVDWYLFTVLLQKGLQARYIKDSLVNYRQYSDNMIGINRFDVESFRKMVQQKLNHYSLLVEDGYKQFLPFKKEMESLQSVTPDVIESLVRKGLQHHPQPLWWQIISENNSEL